MQTQSLEVKFTHLVTGKTVSVIDKRSILAYMYGECRLKDAALHPNAVWIIIAGAPSPIPVSETEEQLKQLLGLSAGEKNV